MNLFAVHFGKNLHRCRSGLSQETLAVCASLHRTEIGLLEREERLPRIDTLLKLAGGLEPALLASSGLYGPAAASVSAPLLLWRRLFPGTISRGGLTPFPCVCSTPIGSCGVTPDYLT